MSDAIELIPYVVSAAAVVLAVVMSVQALFEEQLRVRRERRVRERGRRGELAAFEASLEAPEFEPAALRAAVGEKVAALAHAWRSGNATPLSELADGDVLDRFRRRIEARVRADSRDVDAVGIMLVEVVNHEGSDEDHIVAWVRIRLRSALRRNPLAFDAEEADGRWTLVPRGGGWLVRDITEAPAPDAELDGTLVALPEYAVERMHRDATLELATADALATDAIDPELAAAGLSVHDTLRELAVVDARFGEHVLETVLERLLSAWVAATTGRVSELSALATSAAAEQLLHPAAAPEAEIVVHDLALAWFTPHRLEHAGATTLTLELEVSGVRYVRHGDEHLLFGGSQTQSNAMRLEWRLALVRDDDVVWRLDDAGDVAPHLYWLPD